MDLCLSTANLLVHIETFLQVRIHTCCEGVGGTCQGEDRKKVFRDAAWREVVGIPMPYIRAASTGY
jgi:hypothetical protein